MTTAGTLTLLVAAVAASPLAPRRAVAQDTTVTLAEAIRLAERVQPRVIQATGNLRAAGARVRTTSLGAYLPSLTFSSSGSESFSEGQSRIDPITNEVINGNSSNRSYNTSLSASLDLFTGFRRGADTRSARATQDASEAALVDARFQQRLATTNQFLDALAAVQLMGVRAAGVRRADEQLKVSVARLRAGSATRSDSLRSLVTLGTARLQLIQAEIALATAEANLARLIGAGGRVKAVDDSSFYAQVGVDTAALRGEAETRSPTVVNARASAVAADASVGAARAAYWPTLTLAGSTAFSGSRSTDYDFFNSRQLSLSLNWSIFNRFNREQQITTQEVNAELAEATAGEAARLVQANLTTRLAELAAAQTRIEITRTSVIAATEDLRVQQERYRLGASTIVDVLTSQEALNQAEVDAVNARFDYLRAQAQIEALIGRDL